MAQNDTVPAPLLGRLLSKLLGDESLATVQKPAAAPAAPTVPRGSSSGPAPRPAGGGTRRDKVIEDAMKAAGV